MPACHAGGREFEPRPHRQKGSETIWFQTLSLLLGCRSNERPSLPCHRGAGRPGGRPEGSSKARFARRQAGSSLVRTARKGANPFGFAPFLYCKLRSNERPSLPCHRGAGRPGGRPEGSSMARFARRQAGSSLVRTAPAAFESISIFIKFRSIPYSTPEAFAFSG